ncbi:MAG: hypothetical protein AAGD96_32130 [Chloroflexota bacterium]
MEPIEIVYDDGVFVVGIFSMDEETARRNILDLGLKWHLPKSVADLTGTENAWFILPTSFSFAIGKTLIEQKAADVDAAVHFNESGYKRMLNWMIDSGAIQRGIGH